MRVEARLGSMPKGQRRFLLNKLLGLRPAEIAGLEGIKGSSAVRGLIIRVRDQPYAGEISLWEVNPDEVAEAEARPEAQRARRRERYAQKR